MPASQAAIDYSKVANLCRNARNTYTLSLKKAMRGVAAAAIIGSTVALASGCGTAGAVTAAEVTTFTDMSLKGFAFDVTFAPLPHGKQTYIYEISMFNGDKTTKSFKYKEHTDSIKGFYTFAQAGLSEGKTGTMRVNVLDDNKLYSFGTANIYYPLGECGKPLSLPIGGAASCAGFSVDLYGASIGSKSSASEYGIFYVFSPRNSGDYIEKVYPGHSVTIAAGKSSITISMEGIDASTANVSLLNKQSR